MGRNEGRRRRRRGDQIALRAVSAFAGVGGGGVDTEIERERRRRRAAGGLGSMSGGVNMPRSRRNIRLNPAELAALRAARSGTLNVSTASPQALKIAVRNLTRRGFINAQSLGRGRRTYSITNDGEEVLRR